MFGMRDIKEMDVQELNELISDSSHPEVQPNFKFLDVRTPAEVARGKIAGCENIPLHLIPLKVTEFKADEKIIIYCQTGARSAQACAFLASKGIENAINVRGGIVAWARMGYPISL
jgi:rhodanese-related sulfurtransferase